jgi:GntR family transcriptional regulator/MocR family aminotransferase
VLCRALAVRGVERLAVESPGWPQHRLIAEAAGLEPVEIPVDEHGISVGELSACGCEAVVLTPAHQFPTGVVLSSERRAALLEWADDEDALIIEDDYDSELRYDRDAVGALQGLAPERIAYIGSASKRLGPGLRLGWVLSPSWLTGALTYEKALADGGSPVLEQLAMADFLQRGELDRHLRRMRLRYRSRREALVAGVPAALPGARAAGIAAGLFVPVRMPGVDLEGLSAAAAARGVSITVEGSSLVLGFGNLSERAIADGLKALAGAVRQL